VPPQQTSKEAERTILANAWSSFERNPLAGRRELADLGSDVPGKPITIGGAVLSLNPGTTG